MSHELIEPLATSRIRPWLIYASRALVGRVEFDGLVVWVSMIEGREREGADAYRSTNKREDRPFSEVVTTTRSPGASACVCWFVGGGTAVVVGADGRLPLVHAYGGCLLDRGRGAHHAAPPNKQLPRTHPLLQYLSDAKELNCSLIVSKVLYKPRYSLQQSLPNRS